MSFLEKKFCTIKPEALPKYTFTQEANYKGRACNIVRLLKDRIKLVRSREIERADAIVWGLSDMKQGTTVTISANHKAIYELFAIEDLFNHAAPANLTDYIGEELLVLGVDNGFVEVSHEASGFAAHVPFAALIPDFDSQIKDLSLPLLQKRLPKFFQDAAAYGSRIVELFGEVFVTFEEHNGKRGFTVRKCTAVDKCVNLSKYMEFTDAGSAVTFAKKVASK